MAPITLYFDGHCNLCNRYVDFLIRKDKVSKFVFAPLTGETAKQNIPENFLKIDSIILQKQDKFYAKSAAILQIAKALGWPWRCLLIFWLIPYPIRDFFYDFVAKRRFKWYGRKEQCRVPTEDELKRFLP